MSQLEDAVRVFGISEYEQGYAEGLAEGIARGSRQAMQASFAMVDLVPTIRKFLKWAEAIENEAPATSSNQSSSRTA